MPNLGPKILHILRIIGKFEREAAFEPAKY